MNNYIAFTIAGMFIVTYIPRIIPTIVFSKYEMPNLLKRIVKYVPISVFSYLIAVEVLFQDGRLSIGLDNLKLIPAIATGIIAFKFKSIGLTIAFGVAAFLLYQYSMVVVLF